MAELYGSWNPATDENLNPLAGALLYTYDSVATTTPKTTYTDPGLTAPHENPIEADGSGKFPQVFAENGESFYLVLKTAAGVLVEDYEQVDALGNTGDGTFTRDFDAGGRWRVLGALGVVSEEFGPPSGDDVGGDFRVGGWNGTQAETGEFDIAVATFTGALDAASFRVAGVVNPFPQRLATGSVSAAAQADIALPANFDRYELEIFNASASSTVSLLAQFSFDSAATFKSASLDYAYQGFGQDNSSTVNNAVSTGSGIAVGNLIAVADACRLLLDVRSQALHESHIRSSWTALNVGSVSQSKSGIFYGFTNSKSYGKATHIRIVPNTGTVTFNWRLTGLS